MSQDEVRASGPISGKPLIGIRVFSALLFVIAIVIVFLLSSSGAVQYYGTGTGSPSKEVITTRLLVTELKANGIPITSSFYEVGQANYYPAAGLQSDCSLPTEGIYSAQVKYETLLSTTKTVSLLKTITTLSNGSTLKWKFSSAAKATDSTISLSISIPGIKTSAAATAPVFAIGQIEPSKGKNYGFSSFEQRKL